MATIKAIFQNKGSVNSVLMLFCNFTSEERKEK